MCEFVCAWMCFYRVFRVYLFSFSSIEFVKLSKKFKFHGNFLLCQVASGNRRRFQCISEIIVSIMSSFVISPNPSSSDNIPYVHTTRNLKDEKIVDKTSSCVTAISTLLQLPNSASSQLKKTCSPNKSFTSVGPVCRICHEDDSAEKLISPCECIGSMGVVHTTCLEKWLSTSNSDNCEICKYNFRTKRRARPIFQWFCNGQSIHGPHGFYGDILCLLLLTPLCFISVYLCGVGSIVYMKHGVWEGIGLAVLSAFLLVTFILWCFVTLRFHWRTLLTWRNTNQVVELIEYQCQSRQRTDNNANRVPSNEPCINV